MIQANELRVGNFIYFPFQKEYVKIVGLPILQNGKQGIQVKSKDGIICEELRKQFKRIPITEEILLKAGFEKQGMAYIISVPKKLNNFHITKWSDGRFMCDGALSTEIKHLHQLQNLYFALTAEELNVTL